MRAGVNSHIVALDRQDRLRWFARACLLSLSIVLGLSLASSTHASSLYYDDGTTSDLVSDIFDGEGCAGCHAGSSSCTGTAVQTGFESYATTAACIGTIRNKVSSSPSFGVRMPQGCSGGTCLSATQETRLATWDSNGEPLAPPTVSTTTATSISKTGATLRGTFRYNVWSGTSVPGTYRFRYNTSASTLGSSLTSAVNDTGTANETDSTAISGLSCGTQYFYRGQVTNGAGSANGSWVSFNTSNCTPPVISINSGSNPVLMSEDGSPTPFSLTLQVTNDDPGTHTWSISSAASNGVATASGTGATKVIGYTPNLNYVGSDSFTVQVTNNSSANNATATYVVNVTVSAVNDPPVITTPAPAAVVMDEDSSPTAFSLTVNANDPDTAAGSMTWSISSAASNGTATASGSGFSKAIGYTPNPDFNGADSFVVQITDGATPDTITVNVTVNPRNDAPVIGAISGQAATEGSLLTVTPTVTDPDDPNNGSGALTWSIQNVTPAPNPAMSISNTGVLTWTPALGTPPTPAVFNDVYTVTIRVQDDLTHGSTPDDETFTVTVNPPDADSDMVADYNDYCPTGPTPDGANPDNDGDGTRGTDLDPNDSIGGDACDTDDDNDGMPDTFETANSFDPFDAADAGADADNDGVTNLQEFLDGTNPNQRNLVIDATGYLTPYELDPPEPTSIHSLATTVTANDYGPYRPGDNTITWTPSNATDDDLATSDPGNLVSDPPEQPFFVRPLVSLGADRQVEENAAIMISVMLNGDSPSWPANPATVNYTVSGTAGAADHDAVNGTVTFNDGEYMKTINFNTLADASQDPNETIVFTLRSPVNAALGSNNRQVVTIVEDNVAPQVELQFSQGVGPTPLGSTYAGDGVITIDALVSDVNAAQTHSYDWSGTDNALLPPGNTANWTIPAPVAGNYLVDVIVSDQGNPTPSQSTRVTRILRINSGAAPALTAADSDMDGTPDNDPAEGYGDDDGDGIPNYLDAIDGTVAGSNLVPDQTLNADATMMLQTESGLRIGRGSTTQAAERFGALLTDRDVRLYGDMSGGRSVYPNDDLDHVGGVYDFEIRGLIPGDSARVVIPLQSAIPRNAEYRKFNPATGWTAFASDNNNRIASASAEDGACPEPGSDAYQSGLNYLDNCLELEIQDGGPNDTDNSENGVVSDPGTIGTRLTDPEVEEVEEGSGRMSPLLTVSMLLLTGFAWWRRRREVPVRQG